MKKFLLAVSLLWATIFLAGCTSSTDVVTYNNSIIDIQESVIGGYDSLLSQVSSWTVEDLNKSYADFLQVVATAKTKIATTIKDYKGDTLFSDAIKSYVATFDTLANGEMKQAVELLNKNQEKLTEADQKKYDDLVSKIDATTEENDNKFITTQWEFAKKYEMKLEWETGVVN